MATRWPLSRSETGSRRDLTQSRKSRAWRRNWSYSLPESVLDGLGPDGRGRSRGRPVRGRPADRVRPAEPGHDVLGRQIRVGRDDEPLPRDRQAPPGPEELQRRQAAPSPRAASRCDHVAVQPGYSNSASCVSGVSPLSCRRTGRPALVTAAGASAEEPVDDVERVLAEVGHLPAGVVPEPAEVIERPVRVVRPLRGRAEPQVPVEPRRRVAVGRACRSPGMTLR